MNDTLCRTLHQSCGIKFSNESKCFVIDETWHSTLRRFASAFSTERAQIELLQSLNEFLDNCDNSLLIILSPIQISGTQISSKSPKTLFKVFLSLESIQSQFLDSILDKYGLHIAEIAEEDMKSSTISKLLLNGLRWSDEIVDSESVISRLLDILQIMPLYLKRDLITALPEIVSDSHQKLIVTELMKLLDSESELVATILDSLAYLNMDDNLIETVIAKFLARLNSADPKDLPVIVKFMFQNAKSSSEGELIVLSIRKFIHLDTVKGERGSENHVSLLIGSLKSGIKFNKFILDAWYKIISSIRKHEDLSDLDIYILLALHSWNASWTKKVESLMIQKFDKQEFKVIPFCGVLSKFESVSLDFSSEILQLANVMLSGNVTRENIIQTASCIYTTLFSFNDTFLKQDIVNSLVTHVGSGVKNEITESLKILKGILDKNPKEQLARYGSFVKGIIDYMDDLSLEQIGYFYDLICLIALKDVEDLSASPLVNEIQILIKKQLSHPAEKYKSMGRVGALSFLKCISCKDDFFEISKTLLCLCANCLSNSPNSLSEFYDGLAEIILTNENTSENFTNYVLDSWAASFQDDFVMPSDDWDKEIRSPDNNLSYKVYGDINPDAADLLIKVLPSCYEMNVEMKDGSHTLAQSKVHFLCSKWNLLQACEKRLENNLDSVDALLGCGIILTDLSNINMNDLPIESTKSLILSLFNSLCWMRELINSFSTQVHDPGMLENCVKRCYNLFELEQVLAKYLSKAPHVRINEVLPYEELHKNFASITDKKSSNTNFNENSSVLSNQESMDVDENENQSVLDTGKNKEKAKTVSIIDLRQWMREFKLAAFQIINASSSTGEYLLKDNGLGILLDDLMEKCEMKFCSFYNSPLAESRRKRDPLYNGMRSKIQAHELIKTVISVLPTLMSQLESIIEEIKCNETSLELGKEELYQKICLRILKVIEYCLSFFSSSSHATVCLKKFMMAMLKLENNLLSISIGEIFTLINSKFSDLCGKTDSGILFYHMMKIMDKMKILVFNGNSLNGNEDFQKLLEKFMKFEWRDKPQIKESVLSWMFSKLVETSPRPCSILDKYVSELFPALISGDAEALEQDVFLTREYLPLYYKLVLMQLGESLKIRCHDIDLNELGLYVKIFSSSVTMVKSLDKRSILVHALKQGKAFIDVFSKNGLPLLMENLALYKSEVTQILKLIQQGTRVLQTVCGHSKEYRDLQLTAVVPAVRKTLENLLYSVKSLLTKKDALSAFWIGNLKHRSLQGEVLSSQMPSEPSLKRTKELLHGIIEDGEGETSNKKSAYKKTKHSRQESISSSTSKGSSSGKGKEKDSELSATLVQSEESEVEDQEADITLEEVSGEEGDDENDAADYEKRVDQFLADIAEDDDEEEE